MGRGHLPGGRRFNGLKSLTPIMAITLHKQSPMPRIAILSLTSLTLLLTTACDDGSFDDPAELAVPVAVQDEDEELAPDDLDDAYPARTTPDAPPAGMDQLADTPDPSAGYTGDWQPIIQVKSGLCLDGGGSSAGSYVRQHWCHFSKLQQWKLLFAPDYSYYRVQNQRTGLCLDNVSGWLTQQPCGAWPSQRFVTHDPSTPGLIAFESVDDGECWDIPYGSIDPQYVNGSYPCNGQTNQQWVIAVPDDSYACGI